MADYLSSKAAHLLVSGPSNMYVVGHSLVGLPGVRVLAEDQGLASLPGELNFKVSSAGGGGGE